MWRTLLGFAALWFLSGTLSNSAPLSGNPIVIQASDVEVSYFEFGDDVDFSASGAAISSYTGVSLLGTSTLGFGFGFDQTLGYSSASGGFEIVDDIGLFVAGELISLSANSEGFSLTFGNLFGYGSSGFNSPLHLNIIFPNSGQDDLFTSLFDGDSVRASVQIVGVGTTLPEVPLPGAFGFLTSAIAFLMILRDRERRRRTRTVATPSLS